MIDGVDEPLCLGTSRPLQLPATVIGRVVLRGLFPPSCGSASSHRIVAPAVSGSPQCGHSAEMRLMSSARSSGAASCDPTLIKRLDRCRPAVGFDPERQAGLANERKRDTAGFETNPDSQIAERGSQLNGDVLRQDKLK